MGDKVECSLDRPAGVNVGVDVRLLPVILTNGDVAGTRLGEVTTVGLFGLL